MTVCQNPSTRSNSTVVGDTVVGDTKLKTDLEKNSDKPETSLEPLPAGKGTEEDPIIVNWHHNDPEDPLHWHILKKSSIVAIAGISTLWSGLSTI